MRIAHISDLHLTTLFRENKLENIELALQYINETNTDHLAITGDLTDNADTRDFILLRNLFDKYGFLNPTRLSIVIGNHDIFGGVQKAEDIFTFPEKCRVVNYKEKVNEFYNLFPEAFEGCSYLSRENIFPYSKLIDDVLIVGLNSIAEYSKVNNPFASNGKVELQQFFELAEILENHTSIKHKIILIHHHFNKMNVNQEKFSNGFWMNIEKQTMKLKKKKRLLHLFNQHGVEPVLHGHYHESNEYFRKGIRFSNAGASFKGYKENEININMILICKENIDIKIHKLQSLPTTAVPVFVNDGATIKSKLKIAEAVNY
jgi:3',5'-cyclic AMP phosphodiesterase CpdA